MLKAQLNSRKRDAEKHGVPFSIGLEDLLPVPTACPILGIELKHGETGGSDNSPSIDRIRPELGYVKGNVAVISMKANRIKNDATADELLRVYEWLKEKTNEGKEH